MAEPRCSPRMLARARQVTPGTCVICGCVDDFACPGGCAWVIASGERICTAHTPVEQAEALEALWAVDAERASHRRKSPSSSTRTTKER